VNRSSRSALVVVLCVAPVLALLALASAHAAASGDKAGIANRTHQFGGVTAAVSSNSKKERSTRVRHAHSATAASIDQWSVAFANESGDANVTSVTWVSSTLGAALPVVRLGTAGGTSDDPSTPVYVLEMTGTFAPTYSVPIGVTLNCSELTVVLYQNIVMKGFDCGSRTFDLSSLGQVETDSLIGVSG